MSKIKHTVLEDDFLQIEYINGKEVEVGRISFASDRYQIQSTDGITINKQMSDIICDYYSQYQDNGKLNQLLSGVDVINALDDFKTLKSIQDKFINIFKDCGKYRQEYMGVYSDFNLNRIQNERFYEVVDNG